MLGLAGRAVSSQTPHRVMRSSDKAVPAQVKAAFLATAAEVERRKDFIFSANLRRYMEAEVRACRAVRQPASRALPTRRSLACADPVLHRGRQCLPSRVQRGRRDRRRARGGPAGAGRRRVQLGRRRRRPQAAERRFGRRAAARGGTAHRWAGCGSRAGGSSSSSGPSGSGRGGCSAPGARRFPASDERGSLNQERGSVGCGGGSTQQRCCCARVRYATRGRRHALRGFVANVK
jgi:hypothetical protein